ncbi:diguanylate cyclase domain-containing protein [Anaerostipes sp.]|uniref:diguanylate cyclase domain-containing protein n=1 Tax=Anaerostipes sp. TaxID=1872530 RepID=UPI0025BAFE6B|nr:sensor domain-containing diguanylate cyclase [Anaerostipes sp.]
MKRVEKEQRDQRENILTYTPILKYMIFFCVMAMLVVSVGGIFISVQRMKKEAAAAHKSVETQVTNRVSESLKLLESLAVQPDYYDPSLPPLKKVEKLDRISEKYGYMMICFVDDNMDVYTIGEEPASLASRDYMQQLFSTGEPQVTDSFLAGADGVTLNYTVAYPLKQGNKITGCLFCAIYFDDVVNILKEAVKTSDVQAVLIGSKGQIMSSTNNLQYGEPYLDYAREAYNFGVTVDQLETNLLAKSPGSYWSFRNGNLYYTMYNNVEDTDWDILTSIDFWSIYKTIITGFLLIIVLMAVLCIVIFLLIKRFIQKQKEVVDMLVQSIQELEEKIYQDERPDDMDFREIIRLTSNGLSDGLTGVVTRSVFLKQAQSMLDKIPEEKIVALCFVDLDNLKILNDTYGHNVGDTALKSIGYILREYEKKYDGVVGRYGGDEFVMLLTDIDDEKELRSVLESLALRLHLDIGTKGEALPIQCSVGAAVRHPGTCLEQMIAHADEALYFVKQNGKGYYKIYQD